MTKEEKKESSELLAENKSIVVPGQVIAKGMNYLPTEGTYRKEKDIIASRMGILNINGKIIKTIPLKGRYMPKKNDLIIGKVRDIAMAGWSIDISNCAYRGFIRLEDGSSSYIERGEDLKRYFDIGEYLATKVTNVSGQNLIDLTMKGPNLKKLKAGRIIKINPHKVPRIIGKKGSMISLIKRKTNCEILIGQNGIVWVYSKDSKYNEVIAIESIKKVAEESNSGGLTEKIEKFLDKNIKK
ncbi:RNA-binding protein [Candidatus Woesearchaeota archaeon]|nr:RNA-binding protein [Candidatus Woesearchaeota archaeon]